MTWWGFIAAGFVSIAAYTVGFQHGTDRSTFDHERADVRVEFRPYPFAQVCADMLEAAWSVKDALPHKP